MSEQVAHIPREAVAHIDGYEPGAEIDSRDIRFSRESKVETQDDRVEVVTYTVVWQRPSRVLVGQRLDEAAEPRLHGDSFIGWGGHARRLDREKAGERFVQCAAEREFREELDASGAKGTAAESYQGAIYHPINDVCRDHFAFVFLVEATEAEVRETDKYHGVWRPADSMPPSSQFEPWSRLLLSHLEGMIDD
ncbi:MAG: hypothetical protein ABEN55_13495 [Bradymonadaceae bacterium]